MDSRKYGFNSDWLIYFCCVLVNREDSGEDGLLWIENFAWWLSRHAFEFCAHILTNKIIIIMKSYTAYYWLDSQIEKSPGFQADQAVYYTWISGISQARSQKFNVAVIWVKNNGINNTYEHKIWNKQLMYVFRVSVTRTFDRCGFC